MEQTKLRNVYIGRKESTIYSISNSITMRLLFQLGIISAVISLTFGQIDENEPTHIIKFKTSVSRTAGKGVYFTAWNLAY